MLRKTAYGLFLAVLVALPVYFLSSVPWSMSRLADSLRGQTYVASMETKVRELMPMARRLEQFALELRLLGGQREQGNIFISESGLMLNIPEPDALTARENSDAIAEFARRMSRQTSEGSGYRKHTYLAIIPTAGGVLQQNLPQFAESGMIDQQRAIEELYSQVSDYARTVDVYSALRSRQDQYIFYRTENNLTALGGFYTYSAIGRRMGLNNRSLSQFEIEYVDHAYYGDLYQSSPGSVGRWGYSTAPYRGVQPDILSLYRYSRNPREYTVTHTADSGARTYHTLYPLHLLDTVNRMDVYLGGESPVIDIRNTSPLRSRLLVFGDKTAAAYLPFLCNHYQQVTLVNLSLISQSELAGIRPEQYDLVLFAYGIESYLYKQDISAMDPAQIISAE